MKQLRDLYLKILREGEDGSDRTGVGTRSLFGEMIRFDLSKGFPAVTGKKLAWKAVVSELLWFLEGSTDERRLAELLYQKYRSELVDKKTIWTANADAQGVALNYRNDDQIKELGPIYGKQWRDIKDIKIYPDGSISTTKIDQFKNLIQEIQRNPDSRRLIISAWQTADLHRMSLVPCHMAYQFSIKGGKLNCMMTQRSADSFLGTPFNIASSALLTHLVARETGYDVGELIISMGDVHVYHNHFDAVHEYLTQPLHKLPTLEIDDDFMLMTSTFDHRSAISKIKLLNYVSGQTIAAPMAV